MSAPELRPTAGGTVALFSSRCPGKETPNEDAAVVLPLDGDSAVLAVADGVGGEAAGERAARIAVETLRDCVEEASRDGTLLRTAILDGIERANRAVRDLASGAATTLAVAEIREGRVRPYHVGDCVILLTGQRGRIHLQTVPHSPVGYAVEAGVLNEADAMHHEERHVVSNVIGTPEMRIEIGHSRRMRPRDTLLLASDGLADNLHVEEIVERIRKGPLESAAAALASDSAERMRRPVEGLPSKPDDLTFLAFRPRPSR
jgi:serine/threonine protein phosphatase PrpC